MIKEKFFFLGASHIFGVEILHIFTEEREPHRHTKSTVHYQDKDFGQQCFYDYENLFILE